MPTESKVGGWVLNKPLRPFSVSDRETQSQTQCSLSLKASTPTAPLVLGLTPHNLQGSPQYYGMQIREKLHILMKEA